MAGRYKEFQSLNPWIVIPTSYSIREPVLEKIAACVALREIRGLKSFEMNFPHFYLNMPVHEKTQKRLIQMIEDLRKHVTRERE
jgi:hypothetical protein